MEQRLEKQHDRENSKLFSQAAEHRAALENMESRITDIEAGIKHAAQASKDGLEALSLEIHGTGAAVMSLRDIGKEVRNFLGTFPSEMRNLLRKILQSNSQIYQLLLNVQKTPGQSPTGLLDSNIKFEDAMGELYELPYEYFRYWEVRTPRSSCLLYHLTQEPRT